MHVAAATDVQDVVAVGHDRTRSGQADVAAVAVPGNRDLAQRDVAGRAHGHHLARAHAAAGTHGETGTFRVDGVAAVHRCTITQEHAFDREQLEQRRNVGITQLQPLARVQACTAGNQSVHADVTQRCTHRCVATGVGTANPYPRVAGHRQCLAGTQLVGDNATAGAVQLQVTTGSQHANRHFVGADQADVLAGASVQLSTGQDLYRQRGAVRFLDVVAHRQLDVPAGQGGQALERVQDAARREQAAAVGGQHHVLVGIDHTDPQVPALLRQLHVLAGIGQQQGAVDLHLQRLVTITHDAEQRIQAQVLADADHRAIRARRPEDVAGTADARVATTAEALEYQRRCTAQECVARHDRIHLALGIDHHRCGALDAQAGHGRAGQHVIPAQQCPLCIPQLDVPGGICKAHRQCRVVADKAVDDVQARDVEGLVQASQILVRLQGDVTTGDDRRGADRGTAAGAHRVGIEHMQQLVGRPHRILTEALRDTRLDRRKRGTVPGGIAQFVPVAINEAIGECILASPAAAESGGEYAGNRAIAL